MRQRRTALVVSTVAQSLVFQSPASWDVLRSRGYDLVFACGEDRWTVKLQRLGRVESLPAARSASPARLIATAVRLRKLMRQDWDLVQVQTPIAAALVRLVRRRGSGTPLVYVVHGYHFDPARRSASRWPIRLIEQVLARRTDAIATVSDEDFGWTTAHTQGVLVRRLPGAGVKIAKFTEPQPPILADHHPFHLFCGELNTNKDPLFAVAVVRALRARGHLDNLLIVGRGPLENEIQQLAADHPWIRWIPHTDQVERYLHSALCLLAPSWREGLPRVIIEAFATGTPVAARSNRGSRELLTGVMDVLATDATAEDWAEFIEQAIADPPAADLLRSRACQYDEAEFVKAYGDLIDVAAERRTAQASN